MVPNYKRTEAILKYYITDLRNSQVVVYNVTQFLYLIYVTSCSWQVSNQTPAITTKLVSRTMEQAKLCLFKPKTET